MYKALCVVSLLAATFALTSGSKPADTTGGGLPSPLIVAKGKLTHQTAPISTTTIFTPTQTGLYRLSVYMTTTTADAISQQDWQYNLFWSDDAGAENVNFLLFAVGQATPPLAWASNAFAPYWPGQVVTFEAVASLPVSYSVTQGQPDNSAYSLYYTVERLE